MTAQRVRERGWELSLAEEALEIEVLWSMKEYIQRQQASITEYISNETIYEICNGEEQIQDSSMLLRWWYQDFTWEDEGNDSSKEA